MYNLLHDFSLVPLFAELSESLNLSLTLFFSSYLSLVILLFTFA